jgi:hypothetical protein
MFVKSIKISVKLLCLSFLASLLISHVCFADDDEEDGLPKKGYSLGQERPKPQPKPKVIIKEKIVVQCPPGSNWNADVKRCQNEDGEDIAPAPKAKKKPQPRVAEEDSEPAARPAPKKRAETPRDDRYVYPNSKLRFKLVDCSMKGETVTCKVQLTNTAEGWTKVSFGNFAITDGNGKSYKNKSHYCTEHMNSDHDVNYGDSRGFGFVFPLVDPSTTIVAFSGSVNANKGSDALIFENITILK